MKQTIPVKNGVMNNVSIQTTVLDPQQKLDQGKAAAKALMSVAKPISINGKSYLRYEDLQMIAAFFQLRNIDFRAQRTLNPHRHTAFFEPPFPVICKSFPTIYNLFLNL